MVVHKFQSAAGLALGETRLNHVDSQYLAPYSFTPYLRLIQSTSLACG